MNAGLFVRGLVLAGAAALFAQGTFAQGQPGGGPMGGREMRPCSQEPDPAKCEARRKELREHMTQARDACKGKQGQERGECMAQQMCAKAPDPAKCQANAKERMGKRKDMEQHLDQARQACKDKQGRERGQCMVQQMCAKSQDPSKCQSEAREHMEQRRAMREKPDDKGVPPKN